MTVAAPRRLLPLLATLVVVGGGIFIGYSHYTNSPLEKEAQKLDRTEFLSSKDDCKETGTCNADSMYKNVAADTNESKEQADDEEGSDVDASENKDEEQEEDDPSCMDHHESCEAWAERGECKKNPNYMLSIKGCRKSCLVCGKIKVDMGVEQSLARGIEAQIQERIDKARDYMIADFGRDPKKKRLLNLCKNKHKDCALWAVQGECDANPSFMTTSCAPVCHTCDQLDISARCPIDLETMPNAWKPGDVNGYFRNLTRLPEYKQYSPQVLSSPELLPGDTDETADYILGGPWIVVLDNVVSEEEAERLIELGTQMGYEVSYAGGKVLPDGTYERGYSDVRTSANTWCERECYHDPITKGVIDRITNITQIPEVNSEYLQLLKYEEDQFYKTHHDYLEHNLDRQCGVRLMTVFLYLNEVEEGGGTEFPRYNVTVLPKRGRALIWPSVLDEDPDEQDIRTEHSALAVVKGTKYGANAWIHQRNFKGPFARGCN